MKKRVISFLLAVVTVLGVSGLASAVETRASENLESYYVGISAKGNKKMAVSVSIDGVGEQDKIGIQEIEIEHKTSPEANWAYYDSLYGSADPDFYAYKARSYENVVYFDGVPGEIYRVTLTAYAKKGSKSDTGEVTSGSATCK